MALFINNLSYSTYFLLKTILLQLMKKFLYLLLVLPLLGVFTSCDDDDKDLPNVSLAIDYSGGTEENGVVNVVQGNTLEINALKAIPAEGTKEATLTNVVYFLDGVPVGRTDIMPFAININTTELEVGEHYLGVQATVLQVGKSVGFAVARFKFNVLPNDTQEPGGDQGGEGGGTLTPDTQITDQGK